MKTRGDPESPGNVSSSTTHGDTDRVTQFTEKLKSLQSTLIGEDLEWLSLRDLIHLEQQIHDSLGRIRAKKEELFLEQLQEVNEQTAGMRRAANANSNMLDLMVECGPCAAQRDNEHACVGGPRMDAFLFLHQDSVQDHGAEGLRTVERFRIAEDLNKSPPCFEE